MALATDIISALRMRIATTRGHRICIRKAPRWLHPDSIEREYARALVQYVNETEEIVDKMFIPYLQKLDADANALRPSASTRKDATGHDIDFLMDSVRHQVDTQVQKGTVLASSVGQRTNAFNSRQWNKVLKQMLGINIFESDPWLPGMIEIFTSENVALIKSLKGKSLDDIQQLTLRGIANGTRHEKITKQIKKRFGVTKSRARLIARDQVSKLNGQLTELRQTNIGIEEYIWQDSDDARVRQTHRQHDGERYRWDKPPANTGHPGADYQCRCWAEPYLRDVIEADFSDDEVSFA